MDSTIVADTVQHGILYNIGYGIGVGLPFIIIGLIMLFIYRAGKKRAQSEN